MAKFKIVITGIEELQVNINKLLEEMKDATGQGVEESAELLAEIIRSNAPEGPTGRLRRSVTTKRLPDKWGYPPTTMVGLDYNVAPHQHIVEFGTGPRYHKSGKSVGAMPANPFFRKSLEQAGFAVEVIRRHAKKPITKRGG